MSSVAAEGALDVVTVYLLQTALPLLLILWLLLLPPRHGAGFWMLALAAAAMTVASEKLGIWVFPPWWVPHLMALALGGALIWNLIHPQQRPWWPVGVIGWLFLAFFAWIAGFAAMQARDAWVGAAMPGGPSVKLAWPLAPGSYLVVNGGSSESINAHAALLDPSLPLHAGYRGSSYGVDLIAVNRWGLRANSAMPADPARYAIFSTPILSPCTGQVVVAVDGRPDMRVPQMDEGHPAGNHVLLRCDGFDILLGHFRQGSLRVEAGDRLTQGEQIGEVGNSGESSEPHLHIHAQRQGRPEAPYAAAPVAMRLDGRFLVRGDRVDIAGQSP
jgi:hypothetical protein